MEWQRVGGELCLDFANTVGPRYSRPDKESEDALESLGDFLRWCAEVGVIATDSVAALERAATSTGLVTYSYCLDVREAIYRTFAAIAATREPHPSDVSAIMASHTALLSDAVLRVNADRAALTWPGISATAALGPIVLSAVDLLRRGSFDRIRQCPGHAGSCGWLFYDTSKNNSRRWCSMANCGAHNKSHRQTVRKRTARN
ncbi:CGNR zinc finger domain-containing protein [Nocardia sp. NPDC051321]|uniref:CGNR zinc finger domain-containing protein n=1 Tax=Nocardia sp. NPDC051321 TaxID=3364323 RepID=UPI0037B8D1CC